MVIRLSLQQITNHRKQNARCFCYSRRTKLHRTFGLVGVLQLQRPAAECDQNAPNWGGDVADYFIRILITIIINNVQASWLSERKKIINYYTIVRLVSLIVYDLSHKMFRNNIRYLLTVCTYSQPRGYDIVTRPPLRCTGEGPMFPNNVLPTGVWWTRFFFVGNLFFFILPVFSVFSLLFVYLLFFFNALLLSYLYAP